MAGHSHWKSIKHKKAVVDARRGKAWSKIARLIIIAAKRGGNPDDNLALRYSIDKARAANMPTETIEKNIKRGTGELAGTNYESVLYEGYGHGGVAILVDALTDNRNRTAGEIRMAFDKNGGALGAANSVGWMFSTKGIIAIEKSKVDEDRLMELALESGAEDVQTSDDGYEVITTMQEFEKVRKALEAAKIEMVHAEITMVPSRMVAVSGDKAKQVQALIDALDDNDDVQNVYSNADIQDEIPAGKQRLIRVHALPSLALSPLACEGVRNNADAMQNGLNEKRPWRVDRRNCILISILVRRTMKSRFVMLIFLTTLAAFSSAASAVGYLHRGMETLAGPRCQMAGIYAVSAC